MFLNERVLQYLPSSFVRNGNKMNGRCPFCGDSKKSSTKKRGWYYFSSSSYYCFNCGTAMSGIKFLQALSGADYQEIRKEYAKLFLKSGLRNDLSSHFEIPTEEIDVFKLKSIINPDWKNPLSENALNYLRQRKVIDAPFFQDQLYSSYSKDKSKEFILIPWILNGVEAYYQVNDFMKYNNLKYIFPKNKKKLVAGLDNIDVSWPYIIATEGYYDSLFVKNGIALGTKAITDSQLKIIRERYPHHQIVISFDNDDAGIEAMTKMLKNNCQFKFFKWFNQNTKEKDLNDYVVAKNNVNMFADEKVLERLIVDKLQMKMFLIQNGLWKSFEKPKFAFKQQNNHDTSSFWKKRKI